MTSAIAMEGVCKTLGGVAVLKDVDLAVPNGEVVAILGPSGGGKSTLLRCAALLEQPDKGRVLVGGADLTAARSASLPALRARIGMVFQQFNLFPHLTARENVTLGLIHTLGLGREAANARAEEGLARVGLADRADAYPRRLSGGQRQRVAIARAMVMRPQLILFDEPTSSLDAEMVAEVLAVMRDLVAEGMTMLVVSHEIGFVRSAADRILFLAGGCVLEDRPAAAFLDDPQHPDARKFLSAIL